MAIDPLGPIDKTAAVGDPARKLYQNMVTEQETKHGVPGAQDSVSVSLNKTTSTMEKLGTVHEEKNFEAKSIRDTDNALQNVSISVDKMKVQLEKIVKNWPPFSTDSAERKAYLMSCASLRQEIEKMTVPPPPKPVYERNKIVWDNLGIHGGGKLAVPEITDDLTDTQIKTALGKLKELGSTLTAGRSDLLRNVTE